MAALRRDNALHDVEHAVVFARLCEIALRNRGHGHAGIGSFDAAADSSIDADDTNNVIAASHHHMLEAVSSAVLAQEFVEIGVGRHHDHVAFHDVAGAADQKHIGVHRFRHEMSAADKLDGVDILHRQQAPDSNGARHRNMLGITRS
jgi:hypothetical protein